MTLAAEQTKPKFLDADEKQNVKYCIPLWLRDEQMRLSIRRIKKRLQPDLDRKEEPVAVVCYGPSLADTWEQIRDFKKIITCSGAHKFLVDRDIVPTWHCEVDPRSHKIQLIGQPQKETQYLIASACHPKVFDHLEGYDVILWHVFDGHDSTVLPPGEWGITGGCGVGLRAVTLVAWMGYRNLHVFGMDGNAREKESHAAHHPNRPPKYNPCEYPKGSGKIWYTTPSLLEAARATWHELDQMPAVNVKFHGDGLVQEMAKHYVRQIKAESIWTNIIGISKPSLISEGFRDLNAQLHQDNYLYGAGGARHAEIVVQLVKAIKADSVLDYGCGKGMLAKSLPFPIWEYDPAIPGKQEIPRPADLVTCTDVLEHIEPEMLRYVLDDLRRVTNKIGYFTIHTGPAVKTYADGRNTHLIQQGKEWWSAQLAKFFKVGKVMEVGKELHVLVEPLKKVNGCNVMQIDTTSLFSFKEIEFQHEPYTFGVARSIIEDSFYEILVQEYPHESLFKNLSGAYRKLSLSERNNPEQYADFIHASSAWSSLCVYVKTGLITDVLKVMDRHGIARPKGKLTARFEFSSLPADGGRLDPHTDIPSKVVTLVVPIRPTKGSVWQDRWGGGTDILRPLEEGLEDYSAPLEKFEKTFTFPYEPNTCLFFIRSEKSWHSVGPMVGPEKEMRRTLTINLEKSDAT